MRYPIPLSHPTPRCGDIERARCDYTLVKLVYSHLHTVLFPMLQLILPCPCRDLNILGRKWVRTWCRIREPCWIVKVPLIYVADSSRIYGTNATMYREAGVYFNPECPHSALTIVDRGHGLQNFFVSSPNSRASSRTLENRLSLGSENGENEIATVATVLNMLAKFKHWRNRINRTWYPMYGFQAS